MIGSSAKALLTAALLLSSLGACGDSSTLPAANSTRASRVEAEGRDIKIVFADFYKRPTTVFINGRQFYRGVLDVSKENESTGLSLISNAKARGLTRFRLVSGALDTAVTLDIAPDVRMVMFNPVHPPYIEASTSDSTLLD